MFKLIPVISENSIGLVVEEKDGAVNIRRFSDRALLISFEVSSEDKPMLYVRADDLRDMGVTVDVFSHGVKTEFPTEDN